MRISAAERVRVSNRAEKEILRYKDDHILWHKHVHNIELDAMQVMKSLEMDQHRNTIDFSCRRSGKTFIKELHTLKYLATTPFQEEGIVAPRMQQAQTNLKYHTDAIRRSQLLRAYIFYKSGREQLADTRYEFVNRSRSQAYGVMAQVDGDAISVASLEETDEMPQDRLLNNFLPMLGGARRAGAPKDVSFEPQIRITGVFKGADTLQRLIDSGNYHVLPAVNVHLGLEMKIINEAFVLQQRSELAAHEYIRQYLCRNVSATNHIHERYIRQALAFHHRSDGQTITQKIDCMRKVRLTERSLRLGLGIRDHQELFPK